MSISFFSCVACGLDEDDDKQVNDQTEDLVLVDSKKSHNSAGTADTARLSNSRSSESSSHSHSHSSNQENQRSKKKSHYSATTNSNKDNNKYSNMRRASISRRSEHMASPPMRSRSQERAQRANSISDNDNNEAAAKLAAEDLADSERVQDAPAKQKSRIHRRSVSDPFDAQQGEADILLDLIHGNGAVNGAAAAVTSPRRRSPPPSIGAVLEDQALEEAAPTITVTKERTWSTASHSNSSHHSSYTTLPRYPVAETRDKNCWSEPPVSIFSVRGSNYFADKKKETSQHYLMPARGCDLFLAETHNEVDLTAISDSILGGKLRSLPTLLVNFRFPWGCLILYYEVPEKLRPYLLQQESAKDNGNKLSQQELTLAKWLEGNEDYKNERLKLVPYVAEGPWVVRNMVTGRPAVIGKKLPVTYELDHGSTHAAGSSSSSSAMTKGSGGSGHSRSSHSHHSHHHHVRQPLLQCTLDIGSSSATAKRIVSVCRRYMASLTVDIGFVIQAEEASELPEQMMGSTRVHGVDPIKAPQL